MGPSLEVRNSYAVPHNEQGGQVYVDVEFHRAMVELHQKVNPKEQIVGWYSTGGVVVYSFHTIRTIRTTTINGAFTSSVSSRSQPMNKTKTRVLTLQIEEPLTSSGEKTMDGSV